MVKRIILLAVSLAAFAVPQAATIPDGAYGVWQVPSIGTSTPVYESDTRTGQEVVDKENAALIRERGKGWLVADHADSEVDGGIWNVNEMRVGEPAFLITEDVTYCYECIAICIVRNNGYEYSFMDIAIRPDKDDVICLSCALEAGYEYLAYYDYKGKIPT